ncbi:hypothetical protein [Azospirillum doebereinerae]
MLQYRAFVAVAESRSVTVAAERLHRSPSAVSMLLKQLEEQLGTPLFDRGRKAKLTDLGRFVLDEARALIEHDERVSSGIRSFAGGQAGRVDIACIPSIANLFLPQTLCELWSRHPAMSFHVRDMDSRSVVEAIAGDRCEIGIGTAVDVGEELTFTPLFDDPIDVVCAAGDGLARLGRALAWSDLAPRRFLGNSSYSLVAAPELREMIRTQVAYIPNLTSLFALVRSGGGITLLPRINHLHADAGLAFLPLDDPSARRCVGILTRKGRSLSPSARSFLATLRTIVAAKAAVTGITLMQP